MKLDVIFPYKEEVAAIIPTADAVAPMDSANNGRLLDIVDENMANAPTPHSSRKRDISSLCSTSEQGDEPL